MHSFKALLFALIGLVWFAAPAEAVTPTTVASFSCTTTATSCTGSLSATVASGSFVVVVAVINTNTANSFTIADSAGNCATSYTGFGSSRFVNSSNNGSIIVGFCASTGTALTTANTITVTSSTNSYLWAVQAYVVSGIAGADRAGVASSGTWTSGTPSSFASTPGLVYTSEWALGIVNADGGTTADSMSSYTGGFSAVGSITTTISGRPELFTSARTMTSGTATIGATPTSSAARAYNSVTLLFSTTGTATLCNHARHLVGVGC